MAIGSERLTLRDYAQEGEDRHARCDNCGELFYQRDLKIGDVDRVGNKHWIEVGGAVVHQTLFYECFHCGLTTNFEKAIPVEDMPQLPAPTQDNRPPLEINESTLQTLEKIGLRPVKCKDAGLWTAQHIEVS